MKKNILLFGASTLGEIAHKSLINKKYNIVGYIDNDKSKWGKKINGLLVNSPKDINLITKDFEIIITSQYHVTIAYQLLKENIKKFGVFNADEDKVKWYDYTNIKSITQKNNKSIGLIVKNNSGSNTYALYKKIPSNIRNKYEIFYIDENNREHNYYLNLFRSKLIVRTHDSDYIDDQINVQLFHGFPLKALSFMSKNAGVNKIYNQKTWSKLDAIMSYSQTYSTLMNACYGVDGNKYFITGMPRNDLLLNSNGRKNVEKLFKQSFEKDKIVFYLPTFRETIFGENNGYFGKYDLFSLVNYDLILLDNFLVDNGIKLFVKLHPMEKRQFSKSLVDIKVNNIYFIDDDKLLDERIDLYELINAADLLITDYSSIYFDYLLLQKPIIFIPLDLEIYRSNRGFLVEPYDFWAPGPKCYTFNELKNEIIKCLSDDTYYSKERNLVCEIVHHYKDSNSSERVWNVIDHLMAEKA